MLLFLIEFEYQDLRPHLDDTTGAVWRHFLFFSEVVDSNFNFFSFQVQQFNQNKLILLQWIIVFSFGIEIRKLIYEIIEH